MRTTLALICIITLSACGTIAHRSTISGPADTQRGMSVPDVQSHCASFQEEARETLPDGRLAIQYRDHHWTWGAGLLHAAAHHTFYFRNGLLESWETR